MTGLKEFIIEKPMSDWSPEQIAGYLKHIADNGLYSCHETIQRFVYSPDKKLKLYLPPLPVQTA